MELSIPNRKYSVEMDNLSRDDWTYLLQQFDDANIYQTWSYGSVRWGENRLSHQVIKRGEEVVSIAQVTIKKIPMLNVGIAYIPWGPLWRKRGNPVDLENLRAAISCLKNEYAINRKLFLRISPTLVQGQNNCTEKVFEEEGFSSNSSGRCYRTLMVDLAPTIEKLRKNFDQKWRNMLNQAERKDLEIVEGSDDELYHIFLNLQRQMQERKKYAPGVDYKEFGAIQGKLPDSCKMKIIICKYEGEPVSAAVFSAIGDTGIYLLGATGHKGMNTRGSYLLQWQAMQWLKEKGCKWYDLGGINPETNPGVYHFKAGMSGMDVCLIGPYELSNCRLSSVLVRWGERFKSFLRSGKNNR